MINLMVDIESVMWYLNRSELDGFQSFEYRPQKLLHRLIGISFQWQFLSVKLSL